MRTVNIFEEIERRQATFQDAMDKGSRVCRNARVLYQLSKFGARGVSKVNPVLVFVDAFISVCDLVRALNLYSAARERTKQLEAELMATIHEYRSLKKQLEAELRRIDHELNLSVSATNAILSDERERHRLRTLVCEQSKVHLQFMKEQIEEVRSMYSRGPEIDNLETKYAEAITARVWAVSCMIGGQI